MEQELTINILLDEAAKLSEIESIYDELDIGYLTISNALQWRLQYSRVIQKAGDIAGISRVR